MLIETIVVLDGGTAEQPFALLYRDGWAAGTEETLAHLAQWDYGEPTEPHTLDHLNPYSSYETSHRLMHSVHGHGWMTLARKPNPRKE